jgi:hypothetical protein
MTTTTESQITSGKAESTIDTPEWQAALLAFEEAAIQAHLNVNRAGSGTRASRAYDALIAHIEAWGEKDREEASLQAQDALGIVVRNLEAQRDHFKAIAERQAPDLSKLSRYGDNEWAATADPEFGPRANGEYVRLDDVQALLSPAQQEPASDPAKCWCSTCRPVTPFGNPEDNRMVLCPTCGNKRCPHANDHRNACTNSNEPGQPGSSYPAASATDVGQAIRGPLRDSDRQDCMAFACTLGIKREDAEAVIRMAARKGYVNGFKDNTPDTATPAQATPEGGHPQPNTLFDRKLADLQQRGYEVIGRILHKDGEYALFDSSCRWLTQPQYWRLMHEQDGSLFAEPKAAKPYGWLTGSTHDKGYMEFTTSYERAKRECDEHNTFERSLEDFDSADHEDRVPEPLYRAAPLQQVDEYKRAFEEFIQKTDWVQEDKTIGGWALGMHRADVLKKLVDDLRKTLATQRT